MYKFKLILKIIFKYRLEFIIFSTFILFSLLLFRDPFSQRNLIPNFEPFPDTFHYVTAAESLIKGEGLNIVREGRKIIPSVPPLYSLAFVPFYIINNDPRVFYYANVLLSFASFVFFYFISNKLFKNKIIIIFLLFLYATNYFLYWYPTLAMAENLTLPLFLLGVLLMISRINVSNAILAGFVAVGFYATKYASIPLAGSFVLLYFCKLFLEKKSTFVFRKSLYLFISSLLFFFCLFFTFEYSRGNNLLNSLFSFVNMIFPYQEKGMSASSATKLSWFSSDYMAVNLKHYGNSLIGGSERFLWDFTPLVPKFTALLGLAGFLVGLIIKRFRFISISLILLVGSSVIFISNFYAVDMRYIYVAIPSLLIGFGILLAFLYEKFKGKKLRFIFYVLILLLCSYYFLTSAIRIKSQIMLNIRYSETPWYYISVLELNKYFAPNKIQNGKKPIVISAMPPYLIDFYSNGNYTLLPLSKEQEFRNKWEKVWGPNDYSNLPNLYKKYLKEGYPVYAGRYGIGNEGYLNSAFDDLEEYFKMDRVVTACYEQCNIYKLELKN